MAPDSGGGAAGFSAAARSVWGKSNKHDELDWLPLVQHLLDSAQIALLLWDEWLPNTVKRHIEAALPPGARDGRTLVAWLAALHDIGKISPAFASAAQHLLGRMRNHGMDVGPSVLGERNRAPHASVGAIAVFDWMRARHDANPVAANTYADIVGAHHGVPATALQLGEIRKRRDLIGDGVWHQVRVEVLDTMARLTGSDRHLKAWGQTPLPTGVALLLTGAVIVADWIASNEKILPYQDTVDTSGQRAHDAWGQLKFPPPWTAAQDDIDRLFVRRFPELAQFAPRPLQRACFEAAAANSWPKLLIVEAPMGGGKTEGALLAAEAMAATGAGGIYFGLPTMATSNAMFHRFVDWIDTLDGAHSTFLAHSKRAQNELFDEMLAEARTQTWSDDGAIAVPWMTGRKTGLTANFVVGTVDQALMTALYSRHVMLRHLALAGKVVVIDEVHAADDYMRMYLGRALEWLAAYGVNVVLLSATLPGAQRDQLVRAYRRGLGGAPDTDISPVDAYPVLTSVDLTGVTTTAIEPDPRTTQISVAQLGDEDDSILDALRQLSVDGGCIGVIRNTVTRAQQAARALRERFGDSVVLLHSRFLAFERAEREAELVQRLGRDGDRPGLLIVVGTQVLEQSLDIDFDLLITDVAPTDSLLQRMGRLHRHDRERRPAALVEPRVLLTGVTEWSETGPVFDRGSVAVYHEARLLRAAATWGLTSPGTTTTVALPDDIRHDIETAYGDEPPAAPTAWSERLADADAALAVVLAKKRNDAEAFRFKPVPKEPTRLGSFWEAATSDDERVTGSTVRDGEDGIEVLVVRRVGGVLQTLPGLGDLGARDLPDFLGVPQPALARAVARSSLPLPKSMTVGRNGDAVIDALEENGLAGWQQSSWLSGQLILVLDKDYSAKVVEFRVRYDSFLGLVCDPIKEDH